MTRVRAAFALREPDLLRELFDDAARDRLAAVADVAAHVVTTADGPTVDRVLRDVEVLVTGWGAPRLDAALLSRAPHLRAVVHAAGTVKSFVTDAVWARGIRVSSAAEANARPVAEYTLAMILLAGKRVLEAAAMYDRHRSFSGWQLAAPLGNNGPVVGLVGASRTGRQVVDLLAPFDMEILLHDPYLDVDEARSLGTTAVGLDELLRRSDVVSLHAPALAATERMISARELALMRDHSTLINTARGQLVDTEALTAEVLSGRLRAILDVTEPEPLPGDHPLRGASGVLLTPHVAGSLGNELRRLGDSAVTEVERFAAGLELAHPVLPGQLARTA